jgi:hypothetical protein
MTEITVRDNNNPAQQPEPQQPAPAPTYISEMAQWARDASQAAAIAESLSKTNFVPQSMRGKSGDITAAILTGQELGLQPMAALRALDIIQGVPALRAHALRGLVQSRGHSVQVVESTETRCVVRGRRKGEDEWQESVWTIERAQRLGLASKSQWKSQPQTMLIARATGEICRLIAADVLYAAPYAAEELDGDGRPEPTYRAEPVTAAEILNDDGPGEKADPDADAAEQAAAEAANDEQDPWMVPAGGDAR